MTSDKKLYIYIQFFFFLKESTFVRVCITSVLNSHIFPMPSYSGTFLSFLPESEDVEVINKEVKVIPLP